MQMSSWPLIMMRKWEIVKLKLNNYFLLLKSNLNVKVLPEKGTVSFSAGLHGWAFTLTTFAKMYAAKFGVPEEKMMERLWGDNFFDPATKKWTKKNTGSKTCVRGYIHS